MILWLVRGLGNEASISEISKHAYLKSHGVSALIKRMEKNDLLVKDTNKKIKANIFKLTEKGQNAYHASAQIDSIKSVMSSLNKQQRKQLRQFLEILLASVKKEIILSEYQSLPRVRFFPIDEVIE